MSDNRNQQYRMNTLDALNHFRTASGQQNEIKDLQQVIIEHQQKQNQEFKNLSQRVKELEGLLAARDVRVSV